VTDSDNKKSLTAIQYTRTEKAADVTCWAE